MRLIDADALIEDCKKYLNTLNPDRDGKECTRIHWLIGVLSNAPTIEERKRGEWYKPTGMMPPEYAGVYRCSECDELAMRDWKTHKQKLTDFCPNCGADMRG